MHLGELSSKIVRYLSARSQIPMWMKRAVVVSQLSRIYVKSGNEPAFISDGLRLILRVHLNGIPTLVILEAIKRWRPRQTVHRAMACNGRHDKAVDTWTTSSCSRLRSEQGGHNDPTRGGKPSSRPLHQQTNERNHVNAVRLEAICINHALEAQQDQ